ALHRPAILDATVGTWPADHTKRTSGEWGALRSAAEAGTSKVEVRNRTRQWPPFWPNAESCPQGSTVIEPASGVGRTLPLAVCDHRQVRTRGARSGKLGKDDQPSALHNTSTPFR
ncbi:MAG: hypothetical protein ACYCYK_03650, partial [Candidatus Dormibacteria bacterium]